MTWAEKEGRFKVLFWRGKKTRIFKVPKDTSFGRVRAVKGGQCGNEVRNEKRRAKKGKVTWGKKEQSKWL